MEEQVLRNTVNSEALMTAFHQNQRGSDGTQVEETSPLRTPPPRSPTPARPP